MHLNEYATKRPACSRLWNYANNSNVMLVIATIAAAAAAATIARGRNVSRMPIILTVQIPTCDLFVFPE